MISTHGFFEMKSNQLDLLSKFIQSHPKISNYKIEGEIITAFLSETIDSEDFIKALFDEKIILTHFVQRKESLEAQFLKLTEKDD